MAIATVNELPLLSALIDIPCGGVWTADVELDAESASKVSGAVTIQVDTFRLQGFALRANLSPGGVVGVRVVGGAGGLGKTLKGSHYRSVTASIPAGDILREAGEALDAASSLATSLPHWTRIEATAGQQLDSLCAALGRPWRMTLAGKVLIQEPDWKAVAIRPLDILDRDPADGTMRIGSLLDAGVTVLGAKVTRVLAQVRPDGIITQLFTSTQGSTKDRMQSALAALSGRSLDFHAFYAARVVTQNTDGSVDVRADDARLGDMQGVPIRLGTPGIAATVPAGARVMVGFDAGDPSKPFVSLWEEGSVLTLRVLGGVRGVAAQGDVVSVTLPPLTHFTVAASSIGPFEGVFAAPVTMTGTILGGSSILKVP